ncbi:MAG: phosphotransferase [Kaistia sp. SCN 65-12]|nr:MAG: phosphotransferase [Kaistia sp. SCN 65-12]
MSDPRLFIITGAMAAGKSTVAQAVAEALPKAVHLRGDVFRRMIVSGAVVMGPVLDDEAQAQLKLRHDLACDAARRYHAAGFSVVYQDILIGRYLTDVVERLADLDPRIVVLVPDAATLVRRDRERPKTGYSDAFRPEILAEALVRETPRIGLWIDSSEMDVGEVATRILAD